MKKMICAVITLCLLIALCVCAAAGRSPAPGDADGNGSVDILDATRIQRHLAAFSPPIPPENLRAATVSGNWELSVIDATLIQRRLAGLISRFPIEEQAPLPTETEEPDMKMTINGTPVTVDWEDNESVAALAQAVRQNPVTIEMSRYGGFEQVGSLGMTLPRNDTRITTSPGDVILYTGSRMVVFYGANTWEYTRLGRITDRTPAELERLLGGSDVTVTLSF